MSAFSSLVDLMEHRAVQQPNDAGYILLSDGGSEEAALTYADLRRRASTLASQLAERGGRGDRAILVFPQSLDFIVAFHACLIAGIIAVPMMVPRRLSGRDSSSSIIVDCSPRFLLTSAELASGARKDVIARLTGNMQTVIVDSAALDAAPCEVAFSRPTRETIAFLQYTSGSTSNPKGVIVSHDNLLHNLEMIRVAFGTSKDSTYVSWIPLYHDMGLILTALQSFYVGARCVLLSPTAFLQRPATWIRAIHEYRAQVGCAPNFAYDLCVTRFSHNQFEGVDLSSWRLAVNAAETVHADTIEKFAAVFAPYGFDRRSFYPAYGMAEATVLVSAGRPHDGVIKREVSRAGLGAKRAVPPVADDVQTVVGCGKTIVNQRIAVVDPETHRRLANFAVGEIWVSGPNVACGYWQNEEATDATFRARIAGENSGHWLRTGDLGFLDDTGELFVTGRIKELIIIRGVNHYPQDIEKAVQLCHPALRKHAGAAFSALDAKGDEMLVVVQEIERTYRHRIEPREIIGNIRESIADEFEISAREVVLIRTGTLPKTTSGKIQRNLARRLWLENRLEVFSPETA